MSQRPVMDEPDRPELSRALGAQCHPDAEYAVTGELIDALLGHGYAAVLENELWRRVTEPS